MRGFLRGFLLATLPRPASDRPGGSAEELEMAATSTRETKLPAGIRERHARGCASRAARRAAPASRASRRWSRSARRGNDSGGRSRSSTDAKAWRVRMLAAKTQQRLRAPAVARRCVRRPERFIEGIRARHDRERASGETYKPSGGPELRAGAHAPRAARPRRATPWRRHERPTSSALVERMRGEGAERESTIAQRLNPLQAIYRRATQRSATSPTTRCRDVTLPMIRGQRDARRRSRRRRA